VALDFLLANADPAEQQARLRELRAVSALIIGWDNAVIRELDVAIEDPRVIPCALAVISVLPGKQRRQILATYGALHGMVKRHVVKRVLEYSRCSRCGF
jgi:hypothetical protein